MKHGITFLPHQMMYHGINTFELRNDLDIRANNSENECDHESDRNLLRGGGKILPGA